jgi:hypothetical protein
MPIIQANYLDMQTARRTQTLAIEELRTQYKKQQQQLEQAEKNSLALQKSLEIWQTASIFKRARQEDELQAYRILLHAQTNTRMEQMATIALQKKIFTQALHNAQQELKQIYTNKDAIQNYQSKLIGYLANKDHQ